MSGANWSWLAPVLAAIVTATATYLAVARKASGRIATTEAAALWKEAGTLRDVYRDEISRLRDWIKEIEARLEQIEIENETLNSKNRELEHEIAVLHRENQELRKENERLRGRVEELERTKNGG